MGLSAVLIVVAMQWLGVTSFLLGQTTGTPECSRVPQCAASGEQSGNVSCFDSASSTKTNVVFINCCQGLSPDGSGICREATTEGGSAAGNSGSATGAQQTCMQQNNAPDCDALDQPPACHAVGQGCGQSIPCCLNGFLTPGAAACCGGSICQVGTCVPVSSAGGGGGGGGDAQGGNPVGGDPGGGLPVGNPPPDDGCITNADCIEPGLPHCNTATGVCQACPPGQQCPVTSCGNGTVEAPGEQCDDGNRESNDGCSETCAIEGEPQCPDDSPTVSVSGTDSAGASITLPEGGAYRMEVISPEGLTDGEYGGYTWANNNSDDVARFHGSEVFFLINKAVEWGSVAGRDGIRVTNADGEIGSQHYDPPYDQNRKRAADAGRAAAGMATVGDGDYIRFVADELGDSFGNNMGSVTIRLCKEEDSDSSSNASPRTQGTSAPGGSSAGGQSSAGGGGQASSAGGGGQTSNAGAQSSAGGPASSVRPASSARPTASSAAASTVPCVPGLSLAPAQQGGLIAGTRPVVHGAAYELAPVAQVNQAPIDFSVTLNGPASVASGGTYAYQRVGNKSGPGTFWGVRHTVTAPAGAVITMSDIVNGVDFCEGSGTNRVICTFPAVERSTSNVGGTNTFSVKVGTCTNTFTVTVSSVVLGTTDSNPDNNFSQLVSTCSKQGGGTGGTGMPCSSAAGSVRSGGNGSAGSIRSGAGGSAGSARSGGAGSSARPASSAGARSSAAPASSAARSSAGLRSSAVASSAGARSSARPVSSARVTVSSARSTPFTTASSARSAIIGQPVQSARSSARNAAAQVSSRAAIALAATSSRAPFFSLFQTSSAAQDTLPANPSMVGSVTADPGAPGYVPPAGIALRQPVCGNGVTEAGEPCDDGNAVDEDACSGSCRLGNALACIVDRDCASLRCEMGACAGCDSNAQCASGVCSRGRCLDLCGDGRVEAGEYCDDGNTLDGDGCSRDCGADPIVAGVQGVIVPGPLTALLPPGDGGNAQGYYTQTSGGELTAIATSHAPAGATGPAAVAVMAAGAASGWAFVRRRGRGGI